jgi:hypothetical protein
MQSGAHAAARVISPLTLAVAENPLLIVPTRA